jgi:hypothetical protein
MAILVVLRWNIMTGSCGLFKTNMGVSRKKQRQVVQEEPFFLLSSSEKERRAV